MSKIRCGGGIAKYQYSNLLTLFFFITPSLHHLITPSLHHSITPSLLLKLFA
jgi:hypothetical protein